MQTVLVIEDDRHTAALGALYLEREGFRALTAGDGPSGLALARREAPRLVILDLMLPEMDGWDVCRQLRQTSDVPVIMLTARGEEIDRVAGLTLGAHDYVVKPFSARELMARVKAILRRAGPPSGRPPKQRVHGDLRLDLEKRRLKVRDEPVDLTPHEYALLDALMGAPGRIFTRDELLDRLYPRGEAMVVERAEAHGGQVSAVLEGGRFHIRLTLPADHLPGN